MNSENPIEKTVQKLQKEQINIFDWKRFSKINNNTSVRLLGFYFKIFINKI